MKKFFLTFLLFICTLLIVALGLFMTIQPPRVEQAGRTATQTNPPKAAGRGSIFARNHDRLAGNYPSYAVFARPQEIDNPEMAAAKLAEILGQDRQQLLAGFKAVRGYLWLTQEASGQTVEQIKKLDIKGIHFKKSMKRYYPHHRNAAHLIGFSKENQGLDGLEARFDSLLRGEPQNMTSMPMVDFGSIDQIGTAGAHLVTSIDLSIQNTIEKQLDRFVSMTDAESGSAVIINKENGAVIGLANQPTYDPNTFWSFDRTNRRNRAITDTVLSGPLEPLYGLDHFAAEESEQTTRLPSGRRIPVLSPTARKQIISFHKNDKARQRLSFLRRLMEVSDTSLLSSPELPMPQSLTLSTGAVNDPAAATTLQLTTALTSLFNDGSLVTTYLLESVRDKASGSSLGRRHDSEKHPVMTEEDARSLQQQFIDLSTIEARRARFMETALSSHIITKPITESDDLFDRKPFGPQRNQLVTIASAPGILMVITLEKANLPAAVASGRQESVVLKECRQLLPSLLEMSGRANKPVSREFWKESWESPEEPAIETETGPVNSQVSEKEDYFIMPDVTGRSLRSGLQLLQDLHLSINISGSGTIIKQHPAVGATVREGERCLLELRPLN